MALPLQPPFEPMLAKLTRDMPSAADLSYEPKWDGFRCVVFRDGDELDLQSRNKKPLLRYFPELREPLLSQLPDQEAFGRDSRVVRRVRSARVEWRVIARRAVQGSARRSRATPRRRGTAALRHARDAEPR